MTALHPTFEAIVNNFEAVSAAAGTPPAPTFAEPIRLVIELEATEANEALVHEIEMLALSGDRYGNAGIWRESSDTEICQSCHEAMPYFHAEYHNCLKEAN